MPRVPTQRRGVVRLTLRPVVGLLQRLLERRLGVLRPLRLPVQGLHIVRRLPVRAALRCHPEGAGLPFRVVVPVVVSDPPLPQVAAAAHDKRALYVA